MEYNDRNNRLDSLQTIDVNRNKAPRSAIRVNEERARREYEQDVRRPETTPSRPTNPGSKKPNKKKKKKKLSGGVIAGIVLCAILIVALAIVVFFYFYLNDKRHRMELETGQNIQEGESRTWDIQTIPDNLSREPVEQSQTFAPDVDNLDEASQLKAFEDAKDFFYSSAPAEASYVKNYLLIGTDNRGNETDWYGNSDSMIMLSINTKTKKIFLTSFMRDLYVYLPEVKDGGTYDKLNAGHAYGGSAYLCDVISNTFKVKVDKYARVDFYSLIDIIDAAGGIDMYVSNAEKDVLNMYIHYMCIEAEEPEYDYEKYYLNEADKVVHLTGMQAVGYARIRYVGNADYERTERQRKVINALADNIKNMGVAGLDSFANAVLPLVATNISEEDMWELVGNAFTYLGYEIVSQRVPFDDTSKPVIIDYNDFLVPDYYVNATMLLDSIYGE